MSRRAIDADVILGFVTDDDPRRSPRCRELIERVRSGEQVVYLPEAALCDAMRILRRFRRWPAERIAAFAGNLPRPPSSPPRRRSWGWWRSTPTTGTSTVSRGRREWSPEAPAGSGPVPHINIRRDKVWIRHDGTEEGIARELVAAGIPRERIVLAFKPPEIRPHTGYAVA